MAEQKRDMCRLCLGSIGGCDKTLLNDNQYLIESIFLITGLKVVSDPGRSEYLCSQCQSLLEQCVEFRVTCIYNDEVYREMLTHLNHNEDGEYELQKASNEYIKLEPVDLGESFAEISEAHSIEDCEHELQKPVEEPKELEPATKAGIDVSIKLENNHTLSHKSDEPPAEIKHQSSKDNGSTGLPKLKKLECKQCGAMIAYCNLKNHRKIHNPHRKKSCCPLCPKTYCDNKGLARHIKTHHTTDRPQYTCDECGKSYISRDTLKQHHTAVHSGEKRYACTICGEKFTRANSRSAHQRQMHSTTRPYACENCDKTFIRKSLLVYHMRKYNKKKQSRRKVPRNDESEDNSKLSSEEQESSNISATSGQSG